MLPRVMPENLCGFIVISQFVHIYTKQNESTQSHKHHSSKHEKHRV